MAKFDEHITGHLRQMGYRALNIPCLKHQLISNTNTRFIKTTAFQSKLLQEVNEEADNQKTYHSIL